MEKGYNSDIRIFGDLYHIQTEDWGPDSLLMVTRIFKNGAVVKSYKVSYGDFINTSPLAQRRQKLRDALRNQHRKILDLLQSGQILYEKAKLNG
jgi:hypothetical protein